MNHPERDTFAAAAIAQIPFETVRNWMSKNDPAFRPDFLRAFERARAIAVGKNIKKLWRAKDWRAAAYWLERNIPEYAPATKEGALRTEAGEDKQGIIMTPEAMKELSDAYDKRTTKNGSDPTE